MKDVFGLRIACSALAIAVCILAYSNYQQSRTIDFIQQTLNVILETQNNIIKEQERQF